MNGLSFYLIYNNAAFRRFISFFQISISVASIAAFIYAILKVIYLLEMLLSVVIAIAVQG